MLGRLRLRTRSIYASNVERTDMNKTAEPAVMDLDWPLMFNNITRSDLDAVVRFLSDGEPILTQSRQVQAFEREWSEWLGTRHSVFVNSGSSANLITLAALRETCGPGEVILPPLTWVSDIAAVLQNGFIPVFADIDRRTLGISPQRVLEKIGPRTKAVFVTHILGYSALTPELVRELASRNIPLIEDVCESHGATMRGRKLGCFGLMSNFSFYYAHHLSTIEGGMICTDDRRLYEMLRMFRSHGMVRECSEEEFKKPYYERHPDLNPDFIFAFPAYNVRSTEINAVIGQSQLKRLDANNLVRRRNLDLFFANLDPAKYQTDFAVEGSSNYAFTLVLQEPNDAFRDRVMQTLRQHRVEFRRGTSGGGNQLRQPYLRRVLGDEECLRYPNVDHVHFYGFYIGNYPDLPAWKVLELCRILNGL
jgi:CDP-4-dehydro-6-deoxyglucose reductase, E1